MDTSSDKACEALCDDLIAFFGAVKQQIIRLGEQEGLTPVQLAALYWLHRHGELAMGQVAHVMHCDASNVTGIVDRLVAQHLVLRHDSTRDRRTKTLRLTPRGTEVIEQMQRKLPSAIGWDKLSTEEYQLIHKIAHVTSRTV